MELPDEPIVIEGDETRLIQVVENLLHNATKFTDPGGRITAASGSPRRRRRDRSERHRDRHVAEALPTIFELFAQLTRSPAASQGLGIGLALVRRLTEMHGGSVTAHSDGPGRGCRSWCACRCP